MTLNEDNVETANPMHEVFARVFVGDISVPDNRKRIAAPGKVKTLADSIKTIGLRNPITVRRLGPQRYELVAGLHRLEAYRSLGGRYDYIPAMVYSMTKLEARMCEIAENLHRAELTVQERAEQIAEWIELAKEKREAEKVSRQRAAKPQGGRPEGGTRQAARELGLEEREARRAVQIASITSEAKKAAHAAGIDDVQSKLLKVAAAAPEQQVEVVRKLAIEKAATDKIKQTAKKTEKAKKPPPPVPSPSSSLTADEQTAIVILKESVAGMVALYEKYVTHKNNESSVAAFLLDVVSVEDLRGAGQLLLDIEYEITERKLAAEKAKRLAWEAKNPTKAYEKARKEAIECEMQFDMDEARADAKEDGESWSEMKAEWIGRWIDENWDDQEQAKFDADFRATWKREHGSDYPEPAVTPEPSQAVVVEASADIAPAETGERG
jgi:ParB family chromosome partitioning protein